MELGTQPRARGIQLLWWMGRVASYLLLLMSLVMIAIVVYTPASGRSYNAYPFQFYLPLVALAVVGSFAGVIQILCVELGMEDRWIPWARMSKQSGLAQCLSACLLYGMGFIPLAVHPSELPVIAYVLLLMGLIAVASVLTTIVRQFQRARALQLRRSAEGNLATSPLRLSFPTIAVCILVIEIAMGCMGWLGHEWPTLWPVTAYHGHHAPIKAIAWSPDGQHIASADWNGVIQVWEARTGAQVSHDECPQSSSYPAPTLAWSPDGTRLAAGCGDGSMRIWEIASGRLLLTYPTGTDSTPSISWSPDGQRIAVLDQSAHINLVSANSGQRMQTLPATFGGILVWSPNGHYLAVGGTQVDIISASTGRIVSEYHAGVQLIYALAWSPDSSRLALVGYSSGDSDTKAEVVEALSGRLQVIYTGYQDSVEVEGVTWSPDSHYIASFGSDGLAIQVWSASTAKLIFTWHGHFASINSVAWSPTGRYIASGGSDDTVQVWQPDLLGA